MQRLAGLRTKKEQPHSILRMYRQYWWSMAVERDMRPCLWFGKIMTGGAETLPAGTIMTVQYWSDTLRCEVTRRR